MSSLDAETLPSTATAPTVSMQAAADTKGRPQKAKDVQQQLAAAQLPVPGQQQTAFVEDKKETQPPVMDTIKLTNGCTLRWAPAWVRLKRQAQTKWDWRSLCLPG